MVNLECHKGSFCVYTSIFCQEGYCSGCEIYVKRTSEAQKVNPRDHGKSQKIHKPVLVH